MNRFAGLWMLLIFLFSSVIFQAQNQAQNQLDLTNPDVRKMILSERKGMDCAGIFQQTKLKLDAQLKGLDVADASAGISSANVATMTETTTALGQSRRELCEFYKHDPTFSKEDYFRATGDITKGESDASLLFKYSAGKASQSEVKSSLQTVKPQETPDGKIDVNATMKAVVSVVTSVTARVTKAEARISELESPTPRKLLPEQMEKLKSFLAVQPKGNVSINASRTDRDAFAYGQQFQSVLTESGWTAQTESWRSLQVTQKRLQACGSNIRMRMRLLLS